MVFVGRRQGYKGVDLLVEAAGRLAGVTVALLGSGDPLVADAGSARVIDVGNVTDEEKAAWLDAADVLCLPSAHESFGLAVAEAGVSASPRSRATSRRCARWSRRAAAASPSSARPRRSLAAFEALLSSPELRRNLGESGRTYWHAHFSPEAAAQRTLQAYDELIAARGGRARPWR